MVSRTPGKYKLFTGEQLITGVVDNAVINIHKNLKGPNGILVVLGDTDS